MITGGTVAVAGAFALLSAVQANEPDQAAAETQAADAARTPVPQVTAAAPAEGNLALEFLRHLPPTAAGVFEGQSPDEEALPALLMTPRSIEGFSDPDAQEILQFPEAF